METESVGAASNDHNTMRVTNTLDAHTGEHGRPEGLAAMERLRRHAGGGLYWLNIAGQAEVTYLHITRPDHTFTPRVAKVAIVTE